MLLTLKCRVTAAVGIHTITTSIRRDTRALVVTMVTCNHDFTSMRMCIVH